MAVEIVDKQQVLCRLAKSEDREELVERFRGIYGGLDHLPAYYHHYMDYPDRYICAVATVDGSIVGLLLLYLAWIPVFACLCTFSISVHVFHGELFSVSVLPRLVCVFR